jgi:putative endonuclease
MLRCVDNSIYTGITTDLNRRLSQHFNKDNKCAKYTFNHSAKNLETVWQTENRTLASKLEYHIKTLSKSQKEDLIKDKSKLYELLFSKIDCDAYVNVNLFSKIM